MILKSLSFAGFKSFSDKTSMILSENLNVIVGPNGSGKSNIVDAVAWVLGTQSPGALRTSKMEDVIFAGTEKLPEKGFAEVSILFDDLENDENATEIAISRKLYRDGTSEYFMNGLNCRLLDIQDFLIENGIGKQQHTIISQGQIANVLNSKPEEHRETLEQASGVHPFKLKKEKALKRIQSGETEIKRAKDILREIKKQIKPLEVQAQKAKQHEELTNKLNDLRLLKNFYYHDELIDQLDEIKLRKVKLLTEIENFEVAIADNKKKKSKLKKEVGDGGAIYSLITDHTTQLQSLVDKYIGIAQVANERISFKERTQNEIETQLRKSKNKIDDNLQKIEMYSREVIENTKAITRSQDLITKKEKEILDIEKMSAASKEVSEAIIEKEIDYITSEELALKSYKRTLLTEIEQWEKDKERVGKENINHEILLDEIQKQNFIQLVDMFNGIMNREVKKIDLDFNMANKKIDDLKDYKEKKVFELQQYQKSNYAEIKEGITKQRNILLEELDDVKKKNNSLTKEMIKLKEKISLITNQNKELSQYVNKTTNTSLNKEIIQLRIISNKARKLSEELKFSNEKLKDLGDKYRARYGANDTELSSLDYEMDSLYSNLSTSKEDYGSVSIQYSEIANNINNSNSILENSEMKKDELLEKLSHKDSIEIDYEIQKIEKELLSMGNVNYLAKEDYDNLKVRFDDITNNINDLSLAKKELFEHISDIDEEISFRIETAFNSVSINFSEIFNILFPGGKGALTLTDKENILESGIEISAQPRGKKVKKISLLSGGERSLAAIAFLFAIFKSYPSPFYILDEVEAALDDANLHRMLKLLEEFRNEAQFIIVTHQQQTMQVGDVLYGVTMEPGSGSRIFVKSKEQFEQLVSKGAK